MKKILSLLILSFILIPLCEAKDLRFAQISDVRFSKDIKNTNLQKVIKEINRQKDIEFVVFTGDNIDKPSIDNLDAFLKAIKKLNCPYYLIIGDKDVNKHKDLSKVQYAQYLKKNIKKYTPATVAYSFERNGVIFIAADGAKDVIPSPNGFYKDTELKRIEELLEKYNKHNVIILQHFPIIPPSNKENYYTFKPETYLEMISKHKNVKGVISGHFGVNNEKTVEGVSHISTAPIPYYRVIDILDVETSNPTIWAQLLKAE